MWKLWRGSGEQMGVRIREDLQKQWGVRFALVSANNSEFFSQSIFIDITSCCTLLSSAKRKGMHWEQLVVPVVATRCPGLGYVSDTTSQGRGVGRNFSRGGRFKC